MATWNENLILCGNRPLWGGDVPFGYLPEDARHHAYVIGKTGSGKTTLLRNLIIQHIARGHGVGLIDPHGDLAEDLLHHIPPHRADDLVYFNPGDRDFPIGLNLLANVPRDDRPPRRIRRELVHELVLRAAADDVELIDPPAAIRFQRFQRKAVLER